MIDNDIPENDEGLMFLALAYTSCCMPSTSISWGIVDWDDMSITSKFPRRYLPERDEGQDGNQLMRGDQSPNGLEPTWIPGNGSAEEYGKYQNNNIDFCPEPDDRKTFRTIHGGKRDWKQYFIDMLNAYQTSGLLQGHVSSYMKWNKVTGVDGEYISKHFGKLAGGANIVSDNPALRAMLRNGKWTTYRSTFATITGIVGKMLEEIPSEYNFIFSANTRSIIQEAIANSHSEEHFRDIPEMVLAYAYAWNIVTERNLDGLWSVKSAYDELSYANQESIMNVLKEAKSKIAVWTSGIGRNARQLPPSLQNI
jgi:hypothetical protein